VDDSTILTVEHLAGTDFSVVVEDDGRVAYAYLRDGESIVSDVWLYNRIDTPEEPEWKDRKKAPFANPIGYVVGDNDIGPIRSTTDVKVSWCGKKDIEVVIRIHGIRWAVLRQGVKPGWCRLAAKSGPLARPLEIVT
jgi:hypothetical protein